ncbi:MAG: hypothetical protein HY685_00845 [Chloroflexi bacterium]|nr:hypothetical protein [Chloroflexota bacterium]
MARSIGAGILPIEPGYLVAALLVFLGGCAQDMGSSTAPVATSPTTGQMTMTEAAPPSVPPVKGFYNEREIWFIHTEASDSGVAAMLTAMMDSKVLLVSSLAGVAPSLLADVFVFTNGVTGGGPFGFQPDVFDRAPGDEGYTPLRVVNLVAWKKEGTSPRELRSAEEVRVAESRGEVTITRPGAVVNMPILTWPGGHR